VRLLHVILTDPSFLELRRETYGFTPEESVSISRAEQAAKERLERFAAQNLGEIPHETAVTIAYDRAAAILDDEKAWKPDVIVMGTFGFTGFFQLVLGSTAETVARRSLASVVTLRLRT
jgi:nucleotide-binding universal stress UspA family protein